MTIKAYVQGQSRQSDLELFGKIGARLVDKSTHEQLGTAITANPGDLWWVSVNSKGELRGFATARPLKADSLHIRFVYWADDAPIVGHTLIKRIIDEAVKSDCRLVWTNDRATAEIWSAFGFTSKPQSRGSFCRWEKHLQESDHA